MQPGLSVLMNLTHNNAAGQAAVAAAEDLEALAQLIGSLAAARLGPGKDSELWDPVITQYLKVSCRDPKLLRVSSLCLMRTDADAAVRVTHIASQ